MKAVIRTRSISESGSGFLLLLLFAFILIFNDLWLPGLPSYDDCAKAQRGWEMLQSGDIATPQLAGKPNFDHPPFYLWTLALSFGIFGKTEFAARFPGAVMAFLSVWIIYLIGTKIKNRNTGWWAGFFLITSYMFLKLSRRVQTDIPFMLFTALALLYFLKALEDSDKKSSPGILRRDFILWGFFTGIAGLIKSVFIIFPLLAPFICIIVLGRKSRRLLAPYLLGLLVAGFTAGWWYLFEFIKYGGFFITSFMDSFVGGHISGMSNLGRFGFAGYLYEFLRHFWLWLPLTVWCLYIAVKRKSFAKNARLSALMIHIVFPLIMLSFFGDKTIRYVMFLFIPLLVITAFICDDVMAKKLNRSFIIAALVFLTAVSAYVVARPADLAGRPNYDYSILREMIEKGKLDPAGKDFYHFEEDFGQNRLPLLFYTGFDLKGVIYNEEELNALVKREQGFFLLIRKERMTDYLKSEFRIAGTLEKRLLLMPIEK